MRWWHPRPREGATYLFSCDPRGLALFRIGFGLICMWDVLRRLPFIDVFYTGDSATPSRFGTKQGPTLDLLSGFTGSEEVTAFFVVTLFFLICFTVGWRTRIFHVLSALCMISIHNRNLIVGNGGEIVQNLFWIWTFFLPLGRRLSVDALIASMRARSDTSPAELRSLPPPDRRPAWSLAAFGVTLQLAIIYFYSTVQKDTQAWQDGTALAYVLHHESLIYPFGAWWRDAMPYAFNEWATYGTLVVEGVGAALLLSPVWTLWFRRLALLSLVALHVGIWAMVDVGLFSVIMLVTFSVLLMPPDIQLIKRALTWFAGEPVRAHYDSDCGVCHLTARLGARFDRLERITWYGRELDAPPIAGIDPERFDEMRERSVIVHAPGSGRVWTRNRAIARLVAAWPLGRLVAWGFLIPGVGKAYDAFVARRHRVSAWLGLGVCGLAPSEPVQERPGISAASRHLRFAAGALLQAGAAFWMLVVVTHVAANNRWSQERFGFEQPDFARDAARYTNTEQDWKMFRMTVPELDGWLVIDAELEDGRHVDPQTGKPPLFGLATHRTFIAPSLWKTYSSRLRTGQKVGHQRSLRRWLLRSDTPHLELSAEERIVRFTLWWVTGRIPDPRQGGGLQLIGKRKVASGGGTPPGGRRK